MEVAARVALRWMGNSVLTDTSGISAILKRRVTYRAPHNLASKAKLIISESIRPVGTVKHKLGLQAESTPQAGYQP